MEKKLTQDDLYLLSLGVCATEFNELIYPLIEEMLTKKYDGFSRLANLTKRKKEINIYINELLKERHFRFFEYLEVGNQIIPFIKLGNTKKRVDYSYKTPAFFEKMFNIQQTLSISDKGAYDYFMFDYRYRSERSKLSQKEMHYDLNYWADIDNEAVNMYGYVKREFKLKGHDVHLYGVDGEYFEKDLQIIEREEKTYYVPFIPENKKDFCDKSLLKKHTGS